MDNTNLASAKQLKNDEFYTLYADIEREIAAYVAVNPYAFSGKVVYCNCDDPYKSNFVKYFIINFIKLGLKGLLASGYHAGHSSQRLHIHSTEGVNCEQQWDDVIVQLLKNKKNSLVKLNGDGDFRSTECVDVMDEVDMIISNPPFSLFNDYMGIIMPKNKDVLIIGNMNALIYRNVFPYIKNDRLWLGHSKRGMLFTHPDGSRSKPVNAVWYTNMNHGKRHFRIPLKTMEENLNTNKRLINHAYAYKRYDNYDAIEIPFTNAIPIDYKGLMGVPITFMDKYNPDQFKIVGCSTVGGRPDGWSKDVDMDVSVNGKEFYKRILIKNRL